MGNKTQTARKPQKEISEAEPKPEEIVCFNDWKVCEEQPHAEKGRFKLVTEAFELEVRFEPDQLVWHYLPEDCAAIMRKFSYEEQIRNPLAILKAVCEWPK